MVYGLNDYASRRILWADLLATSGDSSTPWIIMGDFNAVRRMSESIGGSSLWPQWKSDLDTLIQQAELDDLRFSGHMLTWNNKQEEALIWRKLDRVLINAQWDSLFPSSQASFLPPGLSDHSPMLVQVFDPPKIKKPFRFFDFWVDHLNFLNVVPSSWNDHVIGSPMFQLFTKLKRLKVDL